MVSTFSDPVTRGALHSTRQLHVGQAHMLLTGGQDTRHPILIAQQRIQAHMVR